MLRKYILLLTLLLILQLGIGCNTALEEEQLVVSTPTVYDTPNYCVSIVETLSAPASRAIWSPDGKQYALIDSGCGIVVDTEQERTFAEPIATIYDGFWKWTTDSRFAIFRYQNAKGNSMTYVFDTLMWEFERTSGCPVTNTGSLMAWAPCGDYPIALAPNAPRFLMENGSIVNLPGLRKVRLGALWNADHRSVLSAEWSPNGDYLAFVTGNAFNGGTLYLAQGDGRQVQQSVSLKGYHSLQWTEDGTSVAIETENNRYIVDVVTMQVDVVSVSTPTPIEVSTSAPTSTLEAAPIKFKGSVSRGQIFEEKISDDLIFRLDPLMQGWEIWIGDKSETDHNFSGVATPPFHGMNSRYIEGWHFRNSDNTGPNEASEKNVNAPQGERGFCFVLNGADYQIAYYWLNDQLLPLDKERQEIRKKYSSIETRTGILKINKLELGNLIVNERAWIENMEFEVELRLTDECRMF